MDLWGKESLKYSVEHARAKLAMLGGAATREEEERQVEDDGSENPDNLVLMIIMLCSMSIAHGTLQICTGYDCS